jgi:hypothetical protein
MKVFKQQFIIALLTLLVCAPATLLSQGREYLFSLKSAKGHGGDAVWLMKRASEVTDRAEEMSTAAYRAAGWSEAIVPGTVLNSLVAQGVYPEPYFGLNNKISSRLIPDITAVGRDFYTYWFRTEFDAVPRRRNERIRMQIDGVNYRAEFWLNGRMVDYVAGMFRQEFVDVTDYLRADAKNVLAVKVYPIDETGAMRQGSNKTWGANNEFRNGGDGEIGKNVTMLMTVGWDFTYPDGMRDRNTGIWRDIRFYKTGEVTLAHPFVKSQLRKPDYDLSQQTVSVELENPGMRPQRVTVKGEIVADGIASGKASEVITFEKELTVLRGLKEVVEFTAADFPQLAIAHPRLWWPLNKGEQALYTLRLKAVVDGVTADSITTRFGIRELTSRTDTPDGSRTFRINGKDIFIKGTNWIPENMLRTSDERTRAELRYTAQAGINLIRFWGGGITESDYFFDLCDELGIMVWTEFWMTGDTKHPVDQGLYLQNVESTVKRIRNHPALAYYVGSNEATETSGIDDLLARIDGTRGYQMQSECCGIHDGSPYKTLNPMRHYDNTASGRGSRVDGFNPEYGAPCLPTVECLREMMPEKDLWPINKAVWDYSDGDGFHLMTSLYTDMVNEYGASNSIDEFAMKAQFVGAMNYKTIWEVWNYNKLGYGDRYTSGFLYWYHNSAIRQVAGRMWDWSLEPTAALYAAANACEPLHPQFDYLKNSVSVSNDYFRPVAGCTVTAEVLDIRAKCVWRHSAKVDLPEEGVVNDLFTIDFPADISPVHFIKLRLLDAAGREVGSNFYWRSTSRYDGPKSMTGPATAGFQSLKELAPADLSLKYKTRTDRGKHYIDVTLRNSRRSIAFFTQLQWLDAAGKPVRPSFYTDNFFSMMPGESRTVTIETDLTHLPAANYSLVLKGFNVKSVKRSIFVP